MQDIRFAFRSLIKNRWVSGLVIACLMLVVAGNTTVFAVFRSYILQPLPFPDAERLAFVFERDEKTTVPKAVPVASYLDYLESLGPESALEDLAAVSAGNFNLTGDDGPPEMIRSQIVSPNLLSMLGARATKGRLLVDADSQPGAAAVVLLTHDFWQRRFGGDPDILGREVRIDKRPTEIVGVLPDDFEYLDWNIDVWAPMELDPSTPYDDRAIGHLLGRLRSAELEDQAQQQLTTVLTELERRSPDTYRSTGVVVNLLGDQVPGPTDTQLFTMIQGAGLFVLLIACANIGNLLLARGQARRRELAMRSALGAGKRRILRQLITESVVLALVGGLAGTLLSILGVRLVRSSMEGNLPQQILPEMHPTVVLFSLGIAAGAGIVFGLVPAVQALRGQLFGELREGGTRGMTGGQRRWSALFVIGEVALTLALLIGAGILLHSFLDVQYGPQGFETDNVFSFSLTLPENDYPDEASRARLQERLLERAQALPSVVSVTSTTALPRGRNSPMAQFEIAGRETAEEGTAPRTTWLSVDPGYLETLGVRLLRGRNLERADRTDAAKVALVDQRFAASVFGEEDPLGQRIVIRDAEREIVGVTTSVRQRRIGIIDGPNTVVYLPYQQNATASISWLLRTAGGDGTTLAQQLRAIAAELDPDLPISAFQPLDDYIATSLAGIDIFTTIVSAFAGFALLLAALGLYGVLAYSVSRRRQEIGVRMAMGARRTTVVGLILGQGLKLTLIGFALGAPLAWGIRKLINSSLGDLATTPALLLPTIVVVLLVVAVAACLLPARRASGLAPTIALRAD